MAAGRGAGSRAAHRQPHLGRHTGPNGSYPRRALGGFSLIGLTGLAQVAVPVDTAWHVVWFTVNGGLAWHNSPIA